MGRRQRRAAETRLRLFRSALLLFAQRGFQNVTVEDITEAADVGKGTFFNYFETKDHVLGVMAEIQLGKVAEALALAADGKQEIHFVLHRLFRRAAEEPGRSPDLARALISSFLASAGVRKIIAHRMKRRPQDGGADRGGRAKARRDRSAPQQGKGRHPGLAGVHGHRPLLVPA